MYHQDFGVLGLRYLRVRDLLLLVFRIVDVGRIFDLGIQSLRRLLLGNVLGTMCLLCSLGVSCWCQL